VFHALSGLRLGVPGDPLSLALNVTVAVSATTAAIGLLVRRWR
jgi:hypothetical protein